MPARRLGPQPGEWIDRSRRLDFEFEGRAHQGFAGDVISSALLAAGEPVLGRSFKYHRPRSVLSFANHDTNVLLQTATRPNIRADVEPLVANERYRAVNTIGGLRRDWGRLIEALAPVLPAGFYYKAFHRPRAMFPYWERLIRHLTGLGAVNTDLSTTRLPLRRVNCDVLIIGGGPAGLAAATTLAGQPLEVILVDENFRLGGSLDYAHGRDEHARQFQQAALTAIGSANRISVYRDAYAAGFYAEREVPVVTREGITRVEARVVIVATGVIEQPAVFRNNDLPGVMLASGAQRLVHRYAVAPFTHGVVLTGNVDGYHAALDLQAAGLTINAIVDLAEPATRGALADTVTARGIRLIGNATVREARGSRGVLTGVDLAPHKGPPLPHLACDGLLLSVGWAPAAQLLHQARTRFEFDTNLGQSVPVELPPGVFAAGRVNGIFELDARIADGRAAAAASLRYLAGETARSERPARSSELHSHPYPLYPHAKKKHFVDFDEDIQLSDLNVACREGFDNVELLKRYTTNGMGPSQGKHSNLNAARFLANYHGQSLATVGTTTARPFYHPVPMKMLAGRRLRVHWDTPMQAQHAGLNAEWLSAGHWSRPRVYRAGKQDERAALRAEYTAVRERVGIIDVSTLGKIEVFGPDALTLLNLSYPAAIDKLGIGMTRYVVMVDQRGTVSDDGVLARFGENHFYLTAGTGHAAATFRQIKQIAALYRLNVQVIERTRQVAAINVAGVAVRAVLQPLADIDLSQSAFPYLGVREGRIAGVPARLMRVGFVGEAGFEIHLPSAAAASLWTTLITQGRPHGIQPFGVDTQRLLRLEKGHVIVGQDTDGVTTPFEANLAFTVRLSKPQFLGKAALELLSKNPARVLVGFSTDHQDEAMPLAESHLVIHAEEIIGRVTSVGFSPHAGKVVGLAMLDRPHGELGSQLNIRLSNGAIVPATVVKTPFYDPDNLRQTAAAGNVA